MVANKNGPEDGCPLNGTRVQRISRIANIRFGKASEIKIGTWNVRSMYEPGKIHNTIHEIERMSIAVLGISEMRWPQTEKYQIEAYTVYYSGKNRLQNRNGVAIIVNEDVNSAVLRVAPISERIIMLRIRASPKDINIVQVQKLEMEEYDKRHDLFHLHRKVKEISNQRRYWKTDRIEDQDGHISLENDQQLLQWKQYIQELFALGHNISQLELRRQCTLQHSKLYGVPCTRPGPSNSSLGRFSIIEDMQEDDRGHAIEKGKSKYSRGSVCGNRTSFECEKCAVVFHPKDCFGIFHK
ncbi:hypothetical protein ILUMI_07855 [Ignelater luminosus]|uniref:Craniofacial development protein 2-like n=1 Tax=Ignelater luminosus TaxID=2038154 RepID=A0A8K0GGG4_IGNLU|nr:hypothetical protein ILUMI_07855 [Ignelater luminosus]